MNAKWSLLLLYAAASSMLLACTTPERTPVVAKCGEMQLTDRAGPALVGQTYGRKMTALPVNSVQFDSANTSQSVAVQHLSAARSEVNTVQVSARLLSCMSEPLTVRVRTSFFGSDQQPLEQPSAWQELYFAPRTIAIYQETSVSPDATGYLIEIAR